MIIESLEKKMSKINEEMLKLKAEERETQKVLIMANQEKLKPLIGMCFKAGGTCAVITGVPEEDRTKTGISFNAYQLPAIFVVGKKDGVVRVEEGSLFSRAATSDDVKEKIREEYEEITAEEFMEELERALQEIKDATNLRRD